jgi:nucleoside phosphorylase
VGVLTIIEEEFSAARQIFEATQEVAGTAYYRPEREGIVIRQAADRSNVPAAEMTLKLVEDYRPEVVMLVGIAGGIAGRADVAVGDVVVPNYLHYGEFMKITGRGELRRYYAYDQPTVSVREAHVEPARVADDWTRHAYAERPGEGAAKVITDRSLVAGEKVLGDPSHRDQQRVANEFTDAVAIDMESIGVARAMHVSRDAVDYNPRLVVVRGISDIVQIEEHVEVDAELQRAEWKPYAACTAAAFARELADRVLATPDPRQEAAA